VSKILPAKSDALAERNGTCSVSSSTVTFTCPDSSTLGSQTRRCKPAGTAQATTSRSLVSRLQCPIDALATARGALLAEESVAGRFRSSCVGRRGQNGKAGYCRDAEARKQWSGSGCNDAVRIPNRQSKESQRDNSTMENGSLSAVVTLMAGVLRAGGKARDLVSVRRK